MPAVLADMTDPVALTQRLDEKGIEYERINLQTFQRMMLETNGSTIITHTALTVPKYRKTNFEYRDNIKKLARVNGLLNFVYKNSVNNQREREGLEANFEPLPRSWGTQLDKTCFISHVTKEGVHKLYLKFKVQHVLGVQYLTLEGKEISKETVQPFLTEPEPNARQGVKKEVVERDYEVKNILSVVLLGKGYIMG